MLKIIARLEHKIGDRIYHLIADQDSPISDVKEALSQFMAHAVSVEKSALEAMKAQEELKPIQPNAVEQAPKE